MRTRFLATVTTAALAATAGLLSLSAGDGLPRGVLVHHTFDEGLDGWTVETRRPHGTTWAPSTRASAGAGAVGTTELHPQSQATLRSPLLPGSEDSSTVVRFDASWWLEGKPGEPYDTVTVRVVDDAGDEQVAFFSDRGNWPHWDAFEIDLGPRSEFTLEFDVATDQNCDDDEASLPYHAGERCGVGFWLDEVLVLDASRAPRGRPAHTPEHLEKQPRRGWHLPTGVTIGWPVVHDEATDVARPNEHADALANPEFLRRMHVEQGAFEHFEDWYLDPFHRGWEQRRGRQHGQWIENRYGALLGTRMLAPLGDGPHPLILFEGGYWDGMHPAQLPILHRLVEQGYVVLEVSPQATGTYSRHPSTWLPAPEFCGDPTETANRWWRKPQEAGFVEVGFCAGDYVVPDEPTWENVWQDLVGPAYTFAMIDALDWALSDDNPWRHRIDAERIGATGWSGGGYGALVASQVDERIDAAVTLDAWGPLPDVVEPASPALVIDFDGLQAEGIPDHLELTSATTADFAAAGVDVGHLMLDDALHFDAVWLNPTAQAAFLGVFAARYPGDTGGINAWVKPVLHQYMTAWFDLHLKGDPTAKDRLTADTFDGTADRTAQGQGSWDPAVGNVPYVIEGRSVSDHLNPNVPSWVELDGERTVLN